jgi:hypothetical protein
VPASGASLLPDPVLLPVLRAPPPIVLPLDPAPDVPDPPPCASSRFDPTSSAVAAIAAIVALFDFIPGSFTLFRRTSCR